jgi:hypothetical protein
MKLKANIDYGKAFNMLKVGLKSAEGMAKDHKIGYVIAYSQLAGFVEAAIEFVEDKTEGETLPINSPTEKIEK